MLLKRFLMQFLMQFIWESKKLHSREYKTAHVTREYWRDGKEKLRKTGNE